MTDAFFESPNLPQLDETEMACRDQPLSTEDVQEAITSFQSDKAPGPDGFVTEFYKMFPNNLATLLLAMYSEALTEGQLPATLREASICLLPRKDKDLLLCGSYRPISLLMWIVKSEPNVFLNAWKECSHVLYPRIRLDS